MNGLAALSVNYSKKIPLMVSVGCDVPVPERESSIHQDMT